MVVLSYSSLSGILLQSIIPDGEGDGEVDFVAPGVAVEDGHVAVGLGNEQHIDLAPAGRPIVKGFAREYQPVVGVVILIEAATQALLMRHEQVAM